MAARGRGVGMGEKPMGRGAEETHEDEDLSGEWTGDDHGGDDPMAGAAGINTTRSNIKHSAGVTGAPAGESDDREDDGPTVTGEPIPGVPF